jgi:hypothetical protein
MNGTTEANPPSPERLGSDACPICGAELKWGITHPLEREKVGLIRRFLMFSRSRALQRVGSNLLLDSEIGNLKWKR